MRMADRVSLAVGIFVLGGLALGAAAILVFGGMRLFTATIPAVTYFPGSVAGLSVGAPVTFRGVKVGTVRSMRVHVELSDLRAVIPVFLDLDPAQLAWTNGTPAPGDAELRRAVHAGLRAQLVAQSLVTGQLAVDLDFRGGPPSPEAAAGTTLEIPSVTSDMQYLKDQLTELNLPALAEKASRVLTTLQRVLDDLGDKATPLAQSLLLAVADARTTLQSATIAIRAVQGDSARTLGNLDRLGAAGRRQLATSGAQLDVVLARAASVLARADTLTASLSAATAPRSAERADVQATLRDLAASAASLRSFTRDLQRNPAATLLGHVAK
jgi:paraquat-inducible protein B